MTYPAPPPGGPPPGSPPGYPPPGYSPYVQPAPSASGMAIAALVLGIMSWVFGGIFCAIPAVILGKMEINAIAEGRSSPAGLSMAQIGFWAGIAHIVLVVLALLVVGVVVVFLVAFAANAPH